MIEQQHPQFDIQQFKVSQLYGKFTLRPSFAGLNLVNLILCVQTGDLSKLSFVDIKACSILPFHINTLWCFVFSMMSEQYLEMTQIIKDSIISKKK